MSKAVLTFRQMFLSSLLFSKSLFIFTIYSRISVISEIEEKKINIYEKIIKNKNHNSTGKIIIHAYSLSWVWYIANSISSLVYPQ